MNKQQIELVVRKVVENFLQNSCFTNVPVGVSARHIHLSEEHVKTLFGEGYELTHKQELMGGQFAANETITIVGSKLRAIENVRVLGPPRKQTQVEISATDAVRLGISPPLRDSGNLNNSAPIAVIGPKGAVNLNEGCILAARHIHMSPLEAAEAGLRDGEKISVEIPGERGVTLNNVLIRVDNTFTLEMHIDTDEANACGLKNGDTVKIK
jgi:putative phosphotransacetylase